MLIVTTLIASLSSAAHVQPKQAGLKLAATVQAKLDAGAHIVAVDVSRSGKHPLRVALAIKDAGGTTAFVFDYHQASKRFKAGSGTWSGQVFVKRDFKAAKAFIKLVATESELVMIEECGTMLVDPGESHYVSVDDLEDWTQTVRSLSASGARKTLIGDIVAKLNDPSLSLSKVDEDRGEFVFEFAGPTSLLRWRVQQSSSGVIQGARLQEVSGQYPYARYRAQSQLAKTLKFFRSLRKLSLQGDSLKIKGARYETAVSLSGFDYLETCGC